MKTKGEKVFNSVLAKGGERVAMRANDNKKKKKQGDLFDLFFHSLSPCFLLYHRLTSFLFQLHIYPGIDSQRRGAAHRGYLADNDSLLQKKVSRDTLDNQGGKGHVLVTELR